MYRNDYGGIFLSRKRGEDTIFFAGKIAEGKDIQEILLEVIGRVI